MLNVVSSISVNGQRPFCNPNEGKFGVFGSLSIAMCGDLQLLYLSWKALPIEHVGGKRVRDIKGTS